MIGLLRGGVSVQAVSAILDSRLSRTIYLSFLPVGHQKTKDGGETGAVFFAQTSVISTHQDETNLACSAAQSNFVAS